MKKLKIVKQMIDNVLKDVKYIPLNKREQVEIFYTLQTIQTILQEGINDLQSKRH